MSSPVRYPASSAPSSPAAPILNIAKIKLRNNNNSNRSENDSDSDNDNNNKSPRKRRKVWIHPHQQEGRDDSPTSSTGELTPLLSSTSFTFPRPTTTTIPKSTIATQRIPGFLAVDDDSNSDHEDGIAVKQKETKGLQLGASSLLRKRVTGKETVMVGDDRSNGNVTLGPAVKSHKRTSTTLNSHLSPDDKPSSASASSKPKGRPYFQIPNGESSSSATASAYLNLGSGLGSGRMSQQDLPSRSSGFIAKTSSGLSISIPRRTVTERVSYEQLIGSRSLSGPGLAQKSYYGINIHNLIDEADRLTLANQYRRETEEIIKQTSKPQVQTKRLLWMEKYRAKSFAALVGDERTHRQVLRWFNRWDSIVFPSRRKRRNNGGDRNQDIDEPPHRKLLLLTGPPGFGKTTLAHVCARQVGYEVGEINASDDRTANVVRTRIKDMLGTENVRNGISGKVGSPVCVVVDEVDGVVGSGGNSESGFIKSLLDLVERDSINSKKIAEEKWGATTGTAKKKKGRGGKDKFRMLRPLVMICNDLYAPSLRLLRQSPHVEIVHVRPPSIGMIVTRLESIFQRESVASDPDAVRRICEISWGVESRSAAGASAMTGASVLGGDIRSVMVTAEAVVTKWRIENPSSSAIPSNNSRPTIRMSRGWVENCLIGNAGDSTGSGGMTMRSSTRTIGSKEILERVFRENAGIGKNELDRLLRALTVADSARKIEGLDERLSGAGGGDGTKRVAMERLAQLLDSCGEVDRVVSDIFHSYLTRPFQDDTRLSKQLCAHQFLHFHDQVSSRVHGSNHEWELGRYLNLTSLAFHNLFATSAAFASQNSHLVRNIGVGVGAAGSNNNGGKGNLPPPAFAVSIANDTAQKAHAATILHLESCMPYPSSGTFRGKSMIVTELVPYLVRIISPNVTIIGARGAGGFGAGGGGGAGFANRAGFAGTGPKPPPTAPIPSKLPQKALSGGRQHTDISVTAENIVSVRKASEKAMLGIAVNATLATGLSFDRIRIDSSLDSKPDGSKNDNQEGEDGFTKKAKAADSESMASMTMVTNPAAWIFRLVPPIDTLSVFDSLQVPMSVSSKTGVGAGKVATAGGISSAFTSAHASSFHLRRVIETERQREEARRAMIKRQLRNPDDDDYDGHDTNPHRPTKRGEFFGKNGKGTAAPIAKAPTIPATTIPAIKGKVDFFGRPILPKVGPASAEDGGKNGSKSGTGHGLGDLLGKNKKRRNQKKKDDDNDDDEPSVAWVKYNDGYSNAVKKPLDLAEFLSGF